MVTSEKSRALDRALVSLQGIVGIVAGVVGIVFLAVFVQVLDRLGDQPNNPTLLDYVATIVNQGAPLIVAAAVLLVAFIGLQAARLFVHAAGGASTAAAGGVPPSDAPPA